MLKRSCSCLSKGPLFLLAWIGAACSTRPAIGTGTPLVSAEEAGVELIAPDLRTQNPRQRRVYRDTGAKKILVRVESDFNGDGRVDFVQAYDASGTWVQYEKSDLDGDGNFDVSSTYIWDPKFKRTRLVSQDFDTNYDGKPDLWKEFDERGRLVLRKLDRNFDGKPDYWEYYENGQTVRIEQDRDFDGKPDAIPTPRTSRR